jgi:hypothetical protein
MFFISTIDFLDDNNVKARNITPINQFNSRIAGHIRHGVDTRQGLLEMGASSTVGWFEREYSYIFFPVASTS